MGEDRSLDEFFGESDEASAGDDESDDASDGNVDADGSDSASGAEASVDVGADENGGDAQADENDTVTPAVATFRWSPTGATCDACGEPAQRRWHDEERDAFVCIDCKPW